jgi:hypothetical protein
MNAVFNPVALPRVKSHKGHDVYISYRFDGKRVYYDLHEADEADRRDFTPKDGCTLYRLHSEKSESWPIVCINLDRSLIYFLKDYTGEDEPEWETRGIKLDFDLRAVLNA